MIEPEQNERRAPQDNTGSGPGRGPGSGGPPVASALKRDLHRLNTLVEGVRSLVGRTKNFDDYRLLLDRIVGDIEMLSEIKPVEV